MFQLTNLRLLWVVVVIFWNSIIVLTPNGNFWDCATITFSERYVRETTLDIQVGMVIKL